MDSTEKGKSKVYPYYSNLSQNCLKLRCQEGAEQMSPKGILLRMKAE